MNEKSAKRAIDDRLHPQYRAALDSGDEQRAFELLQVICARTPGDAKARAELAALEKKLKGGGEGPPRTAEGFRADRLFPKYEEARAAGDMQRAFELLQVICTRHPKDTGAQTELAEARRELKGEDNEGTEAMVQEASQPASTTSSEPKMATVSAPPSKEAPAPRKKRSSAPEEGTQATKKANLLLGTSISGKTGGQAQTPPGTQPGTPPTAASTGGVVQLASAKKRNAWPLVAGVVAAVALAAGVVVMLSGGNREAMAGRPDIAPAPASESGNSTIPSEDFLRSLNAMNIPDSGAIAASTPEADREKWLEFFAGLKKWHCSPSWEKLGAPEFPGFPADSAPKGSPKWLDTLLGGGKPTRGLPGLARLARKSRSRPLTAGEWREFGMRRAQFRIQSGFRK